jgi:hypothetical protein
MLYPLITFQPTRREFRTAVLDTLETRHGPTVRADAEAALTEPRRDIFGVAHALDLHPAPRNARRVADAYAESVAADHDETTN